MNRKKSIYIVLIFLLNLILTVSCYAQVIDLKADYEKARSKFEEGDYANTVADLEKLIPEVAKIYEDTASFYEMYNMLGLSYLELKNYSKAEEAFKKTTAFYLSKLSEKKHNNNFLAIVSLAQMYYGQNNNKEAEWMFKKSLEIEKENNGEKTTDYITLLQNLANTSAKLYKMQTVDSIYKILIPLSKEVFGAKSVSFALATKALADLQKANGNTIDAEKNYLESKQILKDSLGTKHKDYLSLLNSLASMYKQKQQFAYAEAYYNEMADIYRSNNGTKSQEYGACINNLALLYKAQNKFEQAEKLLEKTMKAYKSSVGEKDILYINSVISLAGLYRNIGLYNKSENLYLEAKKILFENKGEKNQDYAGLLNNMALLYEETGKYDQAEVYLKLSLQITKDVLSDKHPDYATTLNNLALLYKNMGRYDQAEPMYKQALKIREETLGKKHPEYGASLNNLAEFYQNLGRTKEAEPLYLQASQITKAAFGEKHNEYALSLNNLAALYEDINQYDKAKEYYTQSLQIIKEVLGEQHQEYASTLNNLAFLYFKTNNYKEAENLYKKDLEIIKASLGPNHPNYAKSLSNLADLYEHMSRYAEAEKLYQEALKIRKETLGDQHPDYTYTLCNLARVYSATNKNIEAYKYWQWAISNYKKEIHQFFPSMSEKEKEEFYNKFKDRFEQYNSFAASRYKSEPSILSDMYNTQLATKALLFNASNKIRQNILNSGDPGLIEKFKKWQSDKELLAQLYTLPKTDVKINIDSLENKINDSEKELSLRSDFFKKEQQNYTWQDISKFLKPGEAAIEMIRFRKYKPDNGGTYVKYKFEGQEEKDSVYYAALIITASTTNNPEIVLLKNGTDLENRYIKYYSNSIKFKIEDHFCYENYWQKIAAALPGITKVYFSPDGVYNQINLVTIINPNTKKYILDEIDVHTVTNTKDLLTISQNTSPSKKIVLMGDPDFGTGAGTSNTRGNNLKRLPGSGVEVQKINELLKKNNFASNVYTGLESSEKRIKETSDAKILHIATHGFFEKDEDVKSNKDGKISNPLLKSGLLLAGVGSQNKSSEDGCLTAYEAMNLNLDNTELVVLSACETGLGELKNGEGVYGLQRAFRVAGSKAIIISLWKVNDETTQKLMTSFYEEWLKSGNKREAFKIAQTNLRKDFPEPYYWGAFVIIGE